MTRNSQLIIDIGMSEGNDTAFYLAKGFDVIGVEADAYVQDALARRFALEIASGRLRLLHRAAAAASGAMVSFWHDTREQGLSSLIERDRGHRVIEFEVATIDWGELAAMAGVPYYLKIDIEGAEPAFLSAMVGRAELPLFISAEAQTFRPIQLFRDIGYRHFRLINQQLWHGIVLPDPPLEGAYVSPPHAHHWSGPFGRELPGRRWYSFDEIVELHATTHRLWQTGTLITGWMDCHACLPEAAA